MKSILFRFHLYFSAECCRFHKNQDAYLLLVHIIWFFYLGFPFIETEKVQQLHQKHQKDQIFNRIELFSVRKATLSNDEIKNELKCTVIYFPLLFKRKLRSRWSQSLCSQKSSFTVIYGIYSAQFSLWKEASFRVISVRSHFF